MKIGAVVCEYNPFHSGHRYQLTTARETLKLDAIVGIMSGNFVQRGDAAVYPKQLRAKAALENGMDLVLELPAVLTLQSAERYARNAVYTLHALGCIHTLFFGAECPDTEVLLRIAQVLHDEDVPFSAQLQAGLSAGLSFAAARAAAVKSVIGSASAALLSLPNNILAVEYCKALLKFQSPIIPAALARTGPGHDLDTPKDGFASASAIRNRMAMQEPYLDFLPENTHNIYEKTEPFFLTAMEKPILARLCLMSHQQLSQIADVSEGLENAVKRAALSANSLPELIGAVKSKRYAYSRIRRILLNAYLGITKTDAEMLPPYIRILDFNERGREILNTARKTASLPLAKNGGQIKNNPDALTLWQREMAIERVYQLFSRKTADSCCISQPEVL